jgi:hypothetical protein
VVAPRCLDLFFRCGAADLIAASPCGPTADINTIVLLPLALLAAQGVMHLRGAPTLDWLGSMTFTSLRWWLGYPR